MSRAVARAATAGLTGLVTALLTASPAFADNPLGPSEGAVPGEGLSPGATLLLFVGAPVLGLLLVAAVVWLPGAVGSNRYRPQRGWTASPVWFAGPPDPVAAVQDAQVGDSMRGGARGSW